MVQLTPSDEAVLSGRHGKGAQFAMQVLIEIGEGFGAARLVDIAWAHVAGAYCHTQANIDFARKLIDWETSVAVPTTLTACSFDPRNPAASDADAVALIEVYKAMPIRYWALVPIGILNSSICVPPLRAVCPSVVCISLTIEKPASYSNCKACLSTGTTTVGCFSRWGS